MSIRLKHGVMNLQSGWESILQQEGLFWDFVNETTSINKKIFPVIIIDKLLAYKKEPIINYIVSIMLKKSGMK